MCALALKVTLMDCTHPDANTGNTVVIMKNQPAYSSQPKLKWLSSFHLLFAYFQERQFDWISLLLCTEYPVWLKFCEHISEVFLLPCT